MKKNHSNARMGPFASVIISNFNGRDFLRECLSSLKKSEFSDFEIIVVDAGSSDGSVDMVRQDFPDVELLPIGRVGIGTAINVGIQRAKGEILVFDLNADDVVHKDWLRILISKLHENNYGTIVCGKRYVYGTNVIDSAGARINLLTGATPPIGRGELDCSELESSFEVDYVPVIAASRGVIEKVGLCDEEYEIYFEDADFCYRAKQKGIKVMCVPEARFYHHGSATIGKISQKRIYFMLRNRIRFIIKNFQTPFALSSLVFTPIWLVSEFVGQYKFVRLGSGEGFALIWKNVSACLQAIKWNVAHLRETLAFRSR